MAANRRIAILGAGKIGESLLAGLLSSGWRKPADIVVTGRRDERLKELEIVRRIGAAVAHQLHDADDGPLVLDRHHHRRGRARRSLGSRPPTREARRRRAPSTG